MKPWEERWVDSGLGSIDVIHPDGHTETGVMTIAPWERTRLVSAAPDLVRALLAVEWTSIEGDDGWSPETCPSCHCRTMLPSDERPGTPFEDHPGKHSADCALDVALRKAGVR
jgi:hypothetical protein